MGSLVFFFSFLFANDEAVVCKMAGIWIDRVGAIDQRLGRRRRRESATTSQREEEAVGIVCADAGGVGSNSSLCCPTKR